MGRAFTETPKLYPSLPLQAIPGLREVASKAHSLAQIALAKAPTDEVAAAAQMQMSFECHATAFCPSLVYCRFILQAAPS